MVKVGVLALQGGFIEHINSLRRLGVEAVSVRLPGELKGLSGLIIPGGESTTIIRLMRDYDLIDEIAKLIARDFPVFGTCAGMVLLAKKVAGKKVQPLGAMDIEVRRNAFGRQVDSFETDLEVPALGTPPFHAIFIRAPLIEQVGKHVEVLASLSNGTPVAARDGNFIATAFHPELTDDLRFHDYFLVLVNSRNKPVPA